MCKVFGTGAHRTGTTSLNRALNQLGIHSIHAAFVLYDDIDHEVITKYDGFTDNPIPIIYKALDRKFPGSKFIHTTRDVNDWLESVEWLFTEGRAKFRWDLQPRVARMHRFIYGTTQFDEKVFRNAFVRHNEEVIDYFKDRPQDLLLMDITKGDGWEKLCPFLDKEIPDVAFPSKGEPSQRSRHLFSRLCSIFR